MYKRLIISFLVFFISGCGGSGNRAPADSQVGSPAYAHKFADLIGKLLPGVSSRQRRQVQKHLLSADADLRREAVRKLANKYFAKLEVTPRILSLMVKIDPNPQVRAVALQVLSEISSKDDCSEVLAIAAADKSAMVRRECVMALARHNSSANQKILLGLLQNDTDAEIRSEAALALEHYPDSKTIRNLINAIDDEEFSVAYQARRTLVKLTGRDFGYDPSFWLNWYNKTKNPLKNSKTSS